MRVTIMSRVWNQPATECATCREDQALQQGCGGRGALEQICTVGLTDPLSWVTSPTEAQFPHL